MIHFGKYFYTHMRQLGWNHQLVALPWTEATNNLRLDLILQQLLHSKVYFLSDRFMPTWIHLTIFTCLLLKKKQDLERDYGCDCSSCSSCSTKKQPESNYQGCPRTCGGMLWWAKSWLAASFFFSNVLCWFVLFWWGLGVGPGGLG